MINESWVIIDTETTGLMQPISAVEIAGQRMKGWDPDGQSFRVLLNHDVPIDPMAESVHGYSREYLRQHGEEPKKAHQAFHEYAGALPLVAYNISFDWNRVLEPEYKRLNVKQTGTRGFCAMTLARRVINETENHRLETLKDHFHLSTERSHKGINDVKVVVSLFSKIFKERLTAAGIVGFNSVANFSKKVPIAKCFEGLKCARPNVKVRRKKTPDSTGYFAELRGFCKGIMADGVLYDKEIFDLQRMIASCPVERTPEIDEVMDLLERIYEDGVVTTKEHNELMVMLKKNFKL
jgi:DNA polymerase III epsilon subunit-like protein